jgi:ribonuclease P protein component
VLDRRHRLTSSAGFSTATRGGRRAGTRTVVLHVAPPRALDDGAHGDPEVGFVVSKAVGNAVARNRVKRRLRHLARDLVAGLPAGTVLVVRALPAATDATYDALRRDLDAALRRLDLATETGVAR